MSSFSRDRTNRVLGDLRTEKGHPNYHMRAHGFNTRQVPSKINKLQKLSKSIDENVHKLGCNMQSTYDSVIDDRKIFALKYDNKFMGRRYFKNLQKKYMKKRNVDWIEKDMYDPYDEYKYSTVCDCFSCKTNRNLVQIQRLQKKKRGKEIENNELLNNEVPLLPGIDCSRCCGKYRFKDKKVDDLQGLMDPVELGTNVTENTSHHSTKLDAVVGNSTLIDSISKIQVPQYIVKNRESSQQFESKTKTTSGIEKVIESRLNTSTDSNDLKISKVRTTRKDTQINQGRIGIKLIREDSLKYRHKPVKVHKQNGRVRSINLTETNIFNSLASDNNSKEKTGKVTSKANNESKHLLTSEHFSIDSNIIEEDLNKNSQSHFENSKELSNEERSIQCEAKQLVSIDDNSKSLSAVFEKEISPNQRKKIKSGNFSPLKKTNNTVIIDKKTEKKHQKSHIGIEYMTHDSVLYQPKPNKFDKNNTVQYETSEQYFTDEIEDETHDQTDIKSYMKNTESTNFRINSNYDRLYTSNDVYKRSVDKVLLSDKTNADYKNPHLCRDDTYNGISSYKEKKLKGSKFNFSSFLNKTDQDFKTSKSTVKDKSEYQKHDRHKTFSDERAFTSENFYTESNENYISINNTNKQKYNNNTNLYINDNSNTDQSKFMTKKMQKKPLNKISRNIKTQNNNLAEEIKRQIHQNFMTFDYHTIQHNTRMCNLKKMPVRRTVPDSNHTSNSVLNNDLDLGEDGSEIYYNVPSDNNIENLKIQPKNKPKLYMKKSKVLFPETDKITTNLTYNLMSNIPYLSGVVNGEKKPHYKKVTEEDKILDKFSQDGKAIITDTIDYINDMIKPDGFVDKIDINRSSTKEHDHCYLNTTLASKNKMISNRKHPINESPAVRSRTFQEELVKKNSCIKNPEICKQKTKVIDERNKMTNIFKMGTFGYESSKSFNNRSMNEQSVDTVQNLKKNKNLSISHRSNKNSNENHIVKKLAEHQERRQHLLSTRKICSHEVKEDSTLMIGQDEVSEFEYNQYIKSKLKAKLLTLKTFTLNSQDGVQGQLEKFARKVYAKERKQFDKGVCMSIAELWGQKINADVMQKANYLEAKNDQMNYNKLARKAANKPKMQHNDLHQSSIYNKSCSPKKVKNS